MDREAQNINFYEALLRNMQSVYGMLYWVSSDL